MKSRQRSNWGQLLDSLLNLKIEFGVNFELVQNLLLYPKPSIKCL